MVKVTKKSGPIDDQTHMEHRNISFYYCSLKILTRILFLRPSYNLGDDFRRLGRKCRGFAQQLLWAEFVHCYKIASSTYEIHRLWCFAHCAGLYLYY
jgi:hypothetical protein